MVESERVLGKGRTRESIEKHSKRVPEKVEFFASIENCPGEYRKRWNPCEYRETVQASTRKGSNLCEYRKMVESGRVPGKGRIPTSIE